MRQPVQVQMMSARTEHRHMHLKKNIIANYLGQGWTALMQIAFIPLYIRYLGLEAYGLIGIFAILQAGLVLLDMGMTPTLNREMARFSAGAHTPQSIRDLLRSLELLCVALALLIAISIWLASGWVAQHWLRVEHLPLSTVSEAIAIMGLVAALRFIESIYRGAILGLQTHVWLNVVTATLATARGLGAVCILAWVSPSIEAFFVWQGCISLASVIVLGFRVHRSLPAAALPVRFSIQSLSSIWNFAGGMVATTFFSLLLTQVDKLLLSKMLSLEAFGIYTLAATVANALVQLVAPLAQSYYPRFTELVTRHDERKLIEAYHHSSQLMTVMVVPVALILMLHGDAVLYLWTGDASLARNSAPLVTLLALGTALLGLMNIPYMLQLAYGWSTFAAKVNAAIVTVQIPVLFWATSRYGAIGAAWVWVAVTSSYIFVVMHIMHRYLLPKEKWAWYWRDNAFPTTAAACVVYTSTWIYPAGAAKLEQLAWLLAIVCASFVAAFVAAPNLQPFTPYKFKERR